MPSDSSYFIVRDSVIQGKGAFAVKAIRKGTRIIEYTGQLIPEDEADRRYDDSKMKRHHTFLFQICDGAVAIDAAVGGNDARFINHSCNPNCEAVEDRGRVFIEAIRAIQPGEELTYNYGLTGSGEEHDDWREKYACRCGAPNCSGNMLIKPKKLRPKPAARKAAKGKRAKRT
ncbi:SET domain-containing protein-lysine N-methyltransferase [bacterium]|nr:SET domain-containing protein-lysine N-methyltransferase [bacterium]